MKKNHNLRITIDPRERIITQKHKEMNIYHPTPNSSKKSQKSEGNEKNQKSERNCKYELEKIKKKINNFVNKKSARGPPKDQSSDIMAKKLTNNSTREHKKKEEKEYYFHLDNGNLRSMSSNVTKTSRKGQDLKRRDFENKKTDKKNFTEFCK